MKNISNIRSKYISSQLQNTSFVNPDIGTNSYMYYGSLSQIQKDSMIWIGGGNNLNSLGPVIINSNTVWGLSLPFPSGVQSIGIQANSFLQQTFYMMAGTYNLSFSYHTRSGSASNPLIVFLNNINIGAIPTIAVTSWTSYSTTFTLNVGGQVIFKIAGQNVSDSTTAINNIVIS